MSWWELAKGAVGPGGVVVMQVLGQDLARVALIKDQQPVEQFASWGPDHPLAASVGSGCLRRTDEDVDAFGGDRGVEGVSELAGAVPDQELDGIRAVAGSIRKLRAAWVVHAPSGWAVMPARWRGGCRAR